MDIQSILPIDFIRMLLLRVRCLTSGILDRQSNLRLN